MSEFATAGFVQRRQMIEDALADVLDSYFDISANGEGERCVAAPGWHDEEVTLVPLWTLASEMEAKLA